MSPTVLLFCICVLGALHFRHLGWAIRWLLIHVFVVFGIESCSAIMSSYAIPNTFLFHVYVLEELVLVSLFYWNLFPSKNIQHIIAITTVLFVGFSVFNSLVMQRHIVYNSNSRSVEALILVVYSIVGFIHLLSNEDKKPLWKNEYFWFNSAILIYFATGLFFFFLSNVLLQNASLEFMHRAWDIHLVLALIYYSLLATGLWKAKTTVR